MGHFGQLNFKPSEYYSDNENTDFDNLYPLQNKVFETYSDDPYENYRYEMRQPAMMPVKRSWGQFKDVRYFTTSDVRPVKSAALVIQETIDPTASSNPTEIVQEKVKEVIEVKAEEKSKTGRNIVLGVGAGLAALVFLNR
jgi:N-acetylneuraminic acid mutarotase